jgi:hypothetical protein
MLTSEPDGNNPPKSQMTIAFLATGFGFSLRNLWRVVTGAREIKQMGGYLSRLFEGHA